MIVYNISSAGLLLEWLVLFYQVDSSGGDGRGMPGHRKARELPLPLSHTTKPGRQKCYLALINLACWPQSSCVRCQRVRMLTADCLPHLPDLAGHQLGAAPPASAFSLFPSSSGERRTQATCPSTWPEGVRGKQMGE